MKKNIIALLTLTGMLVFGNSILAKTYNPYWAVQNNTFYNLEVSYMLEKADGASSFPTLNVDFNHKSDIINDTFHFNNDVQLYRQAIKIKDRANNKVIAHAEIVCTSDMAPLPYFTDGVEPISDIVDISMGGPYEYSHYYLVYGISDVDPAYKDLSFHANPTWKDSTRMSPLKTFGDIVITQKKGSAEISPSQLRVINRKPSSDSVTITNNYNIDLHNLVAGVMVKGEFKKFFVQYGDTVPMFGGKALVSGYQIGSCLETGRYMLEVSSDEGYLGEIPVEVSSYGKNVKGL